MSSSFYEDASLVMIPSGYKTSKVYCAKPTDGAADLSFTRSNDTATRVNSAGLIEKVRTNEVRNSTMVGASAPSTIPTNWTLTTGGLTFTVIGTGTEGGFTYIEINATGTASASNARIGFDSATQILGATGQYWTNSFYFKKVSETAAPDSYAMAIFENTSAGSLVVANVGSLPATTSLARYSYTVLTSGGATVARVQPFVRFSLTSGNSYNFTFRISATQMEQGDIATDYIATTTAAVSVGPVANVPRLDYLNSSCPRLLLEPQRTNGHRFSENFDNAGWTKLNSTISANSAISPDGYQNADKLVDNSTSGTHVAFQSFVFVSGTTYTISVFAKAAEITALNIFNNVTPSFDATFNLANGTVTSVGGTTTATITPYGNGWYRCTATLAVTASISANTQFRLVKSGNTSYVGNGTDGAFIWGAQIEAGAYATSYIPTLGAAVTRGADAASKTGISSLIGQTEGTFFAEVTLLGSTGNFNVLNTANVTTNSITLHIESSQVRGYVYANSSLRNSIIGGSVSVGNTYKMAYAYKSGDAALYLNGVQIGTASQTWAFSASVDKIEVADPDTYFSYQEGIKFAQALLFKTRLSNADLAALTA